MTETLFSSVHLIFSALGFLGEMTDGIPDFRRRDIQILTKIGNVLNIDRWFVSGGF